jgi:uncharacterized protein YkwD
MRRFVLLGALCSSIGLAFASNSPALGQSGPVLGAPDVAHAGPSIRARALEGNVAVLRVLAAPATSCVGGDDPDASVASQEAAMKCMINFARQQAGLPRLDSTRKLDTTAAGKSADILRCNEFSHEACGRDFLHWFRRLGYIGGRCWWAGENLAWGTGSLGTPRSIVKAWLRSPSHRANILGSEYNDFGISLRVGNLSGASEAHVWVNHFGRRC